MILLEKIMSQETIHNPDKFMVDLRQILSQGKKRLGFLLGAGAPMSILVGKNNKPESKCSPLIPDVKQLTKIVIGELHKNDKEIIIKLFPNSNSSINIEDVLTRIRRLSEVIENEKYFGIDGPGYKKLAEEICKKIGKLVSQNLPVETNPYVELARWTGGTYRDHPVEIFTTNYDLLLEESFEKNHVPYFDGFSGSHKPFFDPTSISSDKFPARWSRIWKMHGSLGWEETDDKNIIRTGSRNATALIYPDHLKYDQIEKQPYTAMFERLRSFLNTPDSLLLCSGFSFSDAHISAIISEALAANSHTAVFALQYGTLDEEEKAKKLAKLRKNMSVYAKDGGVIFGIEGKWQLGETPKKEWGSVRKSFWDGNSFNLGDFAKLAKFISLTQAETLASTNFEDDTASQVIGRGTHANS